MSKNLLFFCILLLPSLLFAQKRHLKRLYSGKAIPPGCVQIGDNLFIDETEVTNLDYREYEWWTNYVFPTRSKFYLRDTSVWLADSVNYYTYFMVLYARHPSYDNYPVVGLTWEQAIEFCKWRSDRVYEMLLIELGKIRPHPDQDSSSFFTIENYLSGSYKGYEPDSTIPIPRYYLPTEEIWIKAASGGKTTLSFLYGFDLEKKKIRKLYKKYGENRIFNVLEHPKHNYCYGTVNQSCFVKTPNPVSYSIKNDFGIYQMIGNVAEMTDQKGIAKGGSYKTPFAKATILDKQFYDAPAADLGFRCAVYWEFLKTE